MQNLQYDYLDERYQNLTILGNEEKKSTYLAKDNVTGQIVVKKYVQTENFTVYTQMSILQNPYLIKIYHVARKEDAVLVIMEYVSGKTLEEWQKEIGVFSEKQTIDYVAQLLKGIFEIHKHGIVHRDISPKNILVSTDGIIKLLDFDIGRQYKEASSSDTTILGTVGFAAPEQYGFTQSDRRTDIYAIGVLMNMMLTGHLPKEELYDKGRIGYIIKTCIHIDPDKRYQSIEEIQWEIRRLSGEGEQIKNPIEMRTKWEEEKPDKKEKTPPQEKSIIPGFRTGRLWKKIIAIIYYIPMGVYSVDSIINSVKSPKALILQITALAIYLWLSVLLPLNFLHWMDKVPVVRNLETFGRVVLGIMLWFVLFYYGSALDSYVKKDLLHIVVEIPK